MICFDLICFVVPQVIAEATLYARDLANERADVCHPDALAGAAAAAAAAHGLEYACVEDPAAAGMGMLAAVGQGSRCARAHARGVCAGVGGRGRARYRGLCIPPCLLTGITCLLTVVPQS